MRQIVSIGMALAVLAGGCEGKEDAQQQPPRQFDPKDQVFGNEPTTTDPGVRPRPRLQLEAIRTEGREKLPEGTLAALSPTWDGTIISRLPPSGCPNSNPTADGAAGWEAQAKFHKYLFGVCPSYYGGGGVAAMNHAAYIARHIDAPPCYTASAHNELAGCASFTGVTFVDRIDAANDALEFCFSPSAEGMTHGNGTQPAAEAIQLLIDAPFHRIAFLQSTWDSFGHGYQAWARPGGWSFGNVGEWGEWNGNCGKPATPVVQKTAYYPMPGEDRVPDRWNGNENPQPPGPPNGYPSGYPIMLVKPGMHITGSALCRVETNGTCTHWPHNFVSGNSGHNGSHLLFDGEAFIVPHQLGTLGAVYRVQFFGTVNGTSVAPWWEFRIRQ